MQQQDNPIGVLIAGVGGSVSLCTIIGAIAKRKGLATDTGMVSALPFFSHLALPDYSKFVFGGWEVRNATLATGAHELYSLTRSIRRELLDAVVGDLETIQEDVYQGVAFGLEGLLSRFKDAHFVEEGAYDSLMRIRKDIRSFKAKHNLDRILVINLASTEPLRPYNSAWDDPEQFEAAIEHDDKDVLSPGMLYALAAILEGCAFINFTPSYGSEIPAISAMALVNQIPHAGRDGKTGETLMKTVLAPMFVYRNFKVLSWEGFNMLGNRDGQILNDPGSNSAKTANKDKVLRSIIKDPDMHTRTRIDLVPSLDDWKVAWDFIHFEGFLGTRMQMSFQWQGCDSMLAAPLVLDLIRFVSHAVDRGDFGVQTQLAVFFKNPIGCQEHDFFAQFRNLIAYYE